MDPCPAFDPAPGRGRCALRVPAEAVVNLRLDSRPQIGVSSDRALIGIGAAPNSVVQEGN